MTALTAGKRRLLLLGVALVMAVVAALLVKFHLERRAAELEARYADHTDKTRVVVANRNLAAGTRIDSADFAIRAMPSDMVPPDTVMPGDIERADGQSLTVDLPLGRPLLWGYLSSGTNPSFSDLLEKDRRALTIAVDELNSISGMIRPFDRIDLFIVGKDSSSVPGAGQEAKVVMPLLQDVLVKATGNIVRRETGQDGREYDRRYSTLTLDLLPEEIGKVLIAQENGELKAALKRPEQSIARYRPTRESDLWPKEGGEAGGVVFYVGGRGAGALKPEVRPFGKDYLVGGGETTSEAGEDRADLARQMEELRRREEGEAPEDEAAPAAGKASDLATAGRRTQ